jgi:hypothetical protein
MDDDPNDRKQTTMRHDFGMGDCVSFRTLDDSLTYGVVTDFTYAGVEVSTFDDGFRSVKKLSYNTKDLKKVSEEKVLGHFHKVSKALVRGTPINPLYGAICERKKHYLDNVIGELEKPCKDPYYAVTIPPQAPHTGVYVAMGYYSGQGPSEHMQGLKVKPWMSEGTLAQLLKDTKPEGFGAIPGEVRNTSATSHGDLVSYAVYEVPKKAKGLVHDPIDISVRFR